SPLLSAPTGCEPRPYSASLVSVITKPAVPKPLTSKVAALAEPAATASNSGTTARTWEERITTPVQARGIGLVDRLHGKTHSTCITLRAISWPEMGTRRRRLRLD